MRAITNAMVQAACNAFYSGATPNPFEAMRAALEAAEKADENRWKRISHAPTDGSIFIVWDEDWQERCEASYYESELGTGWHTVNEGFYLPNPTHFRPLLDPPEVSLDE